MIPCVCGSFLEAEYCLQPAVCSVAGILSLYFSWQGLATHTDNLTVSTVLY
jgi:hypothetical protein